MHLLQQCFIDTRPEWTSNKKRELCLQNKETTNLIQKRKIATLKSLDTSKDITPEFEMQNESTEKTAKKGRMWNTYHLMMIHPLRISKCLMMLFSSWIYYQLDRSFFTGCFPVVRHLATTKLCTLPFIVPFVCCL